MHYLLTNRFGFSPSQIVVLVSGQQHSCQG
jgi:hypothetical protein